MIEIDHFDTVTQNQMTLINWFRSMSVFNARFEHVINDNERAENERKTNLRSSHSCLDQCMAMQSIWHLRCRANFLLLPNLSFKPSELVDRLIAGSRHFYCKH